MNGSNDEITIFAKTNFRNQEKRFGIKVDDRRRHMYLIGKTGMGKTTVLENMVIEDIRAGRGLALVDPHGDLVEKIIDYIPSYRINDVVYINPADVDYPVGFNVLENVDPTQRHLVASGLMGVFTKIWAGVWSARMEYILNNCILALLEYPGSTMLGIGRILVDKNYRRKVVAKITDPIVKSFWMDEFAAYNVNFRNEAIAPIQNKVGQFLSSSIIRNIVGQPKSTIDLREIMDKKKILFLNFAKGRIGEDNSALLGAMMITRLQLAAMSRVDVLEEEREDFYLYVDEFQNFATESFASILSEARKYRLNLIIAHQYIEQLDEEVRAAVFGNVGTLMCFRVGAADSEFLAKEFFPTFTEDDLVNLTKYNVYMKLMIDGVASEPFSAVTLPPLENRTNNREKIIKVSRERYSEPREVVEEKILRWTGIEEMDQALAEEDKRAAPPAAGVSRFSRPARREFRSPAPFGPEERERKGPVLPPRDKPRINFDELEPVQLGQPEHSISLQEALHRKPQPFRQRREYQENGPGAPHPPREEVPRQQRPIYPPPPPSGQRLEPGRVVKLD